MSLAQDAPEWLFITVVILVIGLMLGFLVWGAILEIRFISPYTIIKKSNQEKWRKAMVLALLQTSMLFIFGLAMPVLSTPPERLPMFLFCNGLWVVAFPLATLYKRWEFERHIKSYRYFDKQIKDKNSIYNRAHFAPFRSIRFFMTSDQKRFFSEGFPDDIDEKSNQESSTQESPNDL